MKIITLTICFLLTITTLQAQDAISDVWDMGKGNTKIEIKENKGKVVSSDKLAKGTLMLKDITDNGDTWNAKLFNAKKDKWYDAVLEEKNGKLFVTVDAGLISKTLEWSKG